MAVSGKVVIITGGAQGIGRYNARLFASEGAKLAIADVAPMETVVKEVKSLGGEVLPVPTDVRDEDQVHSLMEQVNRHYGRIDVLINDAAIVTHFQWGISHWPLIKDMDKSFFEKVMHTNLHGTFLCTKHVIPYMEAQRSGLIINFGQGTLRPETGTDNLGSCVYAVSKLAIRAFTAKVAVEERDFNICMVSMGPGGGDAAPGETRRGIAVEEAPAEARARMRPMEDVVGNRYLLAVDAPMELSGHQITVKDGVLVAAE